MLNFLQIEQDCPCALNAFKTWTVETRRINEFAWSMAKEIDAYPIACHMLREFLIKTETPIELYKSGDKWGFRVYNRKGSLLRSTAPNFLDEISAILCALHQLERIIQGIP